MSAQSRTRVGIVGAGNIAAIAQLPTLVKRDDVDLVALVSRRPDPVPLMRRWGFGAAYQTVEDMLGSEELDAVFVLTPRSEHAHAVDACLRRDVDVFCEKPLAPSVEEAEHLAELADQRGRILMVDFNRRYAPVYAAGRDAFGSAGATFCVAQKNRPGSEYRATFENAIHMVDLLRWYCGGEAVDVTAHTAGDDPWQEDGTTAIIRFDTGNTGVLVAARTAGAWNEKLDAYGAGRSAEVQAPESVSITIDGVTTTRNLSSEAFGWATATETLGFAEAVHHFLDRIKDRRPPLTSGRDAVATQKLLDRILTSAGLPTHEQEGRQWASHATNTVQQPANADAAEGISTGRCHDHRYWTSATTRAGAPSLPARAIGRAWRRNRRALTSSRWATCSVMSTPPLISTRWTGQSKLGGRGPSGMSGEAVSSASIRTLRSTSAWASSSDR